MSNFSDFDRVVAEMMQDFGFLATYVRTVSSTPNDVTGGVTNITEEIEVQAIKMELIRPTEGTGTKAGSLIQDGDQILYIRPTEKTDVFADALVINPAADHLLINDTAWNIVTVKEYNPSASDVILYELYIRK